MEITSKEQDGATILALAGRLDGATAPELEASCMRRIESGTKRLVLDLGQLEYVSSAGLRVILMATKRLRAAGGALAACGARGVVQEVFTISGFGSLIPITGTLEEAVRAIEHPSRTGEPRQ